MSHITSQESSSKFPFTVPNSTAYSIVPQKKGSIFTTSGLKSSFNPINSAEPPIESLQSDSLLVYEATKNAQESH